MRAQEHRAVGDAATGGARVNVGGDGPDERLVLGFGDVVALSGDFFVADGFPVPASLRAGSQADTLASDGLFSLARFPGHQGRRPGTRDEIIGALKVMAADQDVVDPRFGPGGEFAAFDFSATAAENDVERRVRDRFVALGAANDDHFVAPGRRGPHTAVDRPPAVFGSARRAYRQLHERALGEAWELGRSGGDVSRAMAREAAAQHYLTDAFAAGHLGTPVAAIREFWQSRYPEFWRGLRHKVASDTAKALRELALPLRLVPASVVRDRALAAVETRTSGHPRISLGDLLAKVFHDWDNVHGLALDGGGRIFGDGCLEQGVTRELAVAAARAGADDVEVAFELGRRRRTPAGAALYQAVRDATGAPDSFFLAETKIPSPSGDNPPQNWRAPDLDELWSSPIVGATGTTVGAAVAEALEVGQELPRRLECLGQGVADSVELPPIPGLRQWTDKKVCQAYRRGFVESLAADPLAAVSTCLGELHPAPAQSSPSSPPELCAPRARHDHFSREDRGGRWITRRAPEV